MYSIQQLEAHPTFKSAQDVAQICTPLFDCLGVRDFAYSLVYPDGSRAFLCSSHDIILDPVIYELFNQRRDCNKFWFDFRPFGSTRGCFSSDVLALTREHYPDMYKGGFLMENHYLEKYDIVDRLIITTKKPLVAENFVFTFEKNVPYKTLLFNNHDLFMKFCQYFKEQACRLVENVKDRPLIPAFRDQEIFSSVDGVSLSFPRKDAFLDQLALKEHFIDSFTNKPCLTKKELRYASYIVKGYSAREIGEQCYVSKRTIETHINNIKHKLDVTKKSALIEKLLQLDILSSI